MLKINSTLGSLLRVGSWTAEFLATYEQGAVTGVQAQPGECLLQGTLFGVGPKGTHRETNHFGGPILYPEV